MTAITAKYGIKPPLSYECPVAWFVDDRRPTNETTNSE